MAKGVCSHIIPKNKTPKGEYTDHIDIFIAPSGVLGRKNTCIVKELYLGKIMYFLPKIISQKIQDGEKLEDIKKLILQVYELISDKRGKDSVAKKFASIKDSLLKESLVHETIRFNLTIPPFTSATFEDMKRAAKLLDIPLNEKVYIPELGSWTSEAVPVGIQYFSVLEQLSSDYESTRSTAGYVSATGQPTVGKSRVGGQSLGELDLYNLLTYDAHNVLKELLMARSDNLNDKRELIGNLREYGVSNAPKGDKTGATSKLFNIFMVGQGLWI